MKERPILFSAPMVRAILDGSKTQTRRVVKPAKDKNSSGCEMAPCEIAAEINRFRNFDFCPYGAPGDLLWVRETWGNVSFCSEEEWTPDRPATKIHQLKFGCGYYSGHIIYRADGEFEWENEYGDEQSCWNPSIHMPRAASRITLEITNIRVERLNDISEQDAMAEGVDGANSDSAQAIGWYEKPRRAFERLWESINGAGSWAINPWVWVIEFKKVE